MSTLVFLVLFTVMSIMQPGYCWLPFFATHANTTIHCTCGCLLHAQSLCEDPPPPPTALTGQLPISCTVGAGLPHSPRSPSPSGASPSLPECLLEQIVCVDAVGAGDLQKRLGLHGAADGQVSVVVTGPAPVTDDRAASDQGTGTLNTGTMGQGPGDTDNLGSQYRCHSRVNRRQGSRRRR